MRGAAPTSPGAGTGVAGADRPRILLVDDVPENLLAMEAILRRDDAEVLTASHARAALELLLVHEVAVAVLDVQMPEIDGYELAELLRGVERTRAIPIIFVTAGPHDQRAVFRGYDSGAVDFLFKPIEPHVLASKVSVFLELHRQRRLLAQKVAELERVERRLLEADRRKDEFLAVLSHELRNPLMPIRNAVFILDRVAPGSPQARNAQGVIERQVRHLARLVDDLLDVTRIARGKVQLQREEVDAVELVRRVIDDHRDAFERGELALAVTLPGAPLALQADPTRLAQIVGNLLGNAAKYTPRGGHVAVTLSREGAEALLVVRDDGVGIGPETLGRLFEPFAQADRSLDRSQGGLGLGLSLVRGMVELHGGRVEVASEGPGRGAEFRVLLPLPPHASGAAAPAPAGAAPGASRPRRVLVIEDNVDSAATLRDALLLMGHEVAVAHDGPAGLDLAGTWRAEVVLCDLGLPGLSGFEVATRLRALPTSREALLVAVSGYASAEDQRRAIGAGFDALVAKPPDIARLGEVLALRDRTAG